MYIYGTIESMGARMCVTYVGGKKEKLDGRTFLLTPTHARGDLILSRSSSLCNTLCGISISNGLVCEQIAPVCLCYLSRVLDGEKWERNGKPREASPVQPGEFYFFFLLSILSYIHDERFWIRVELKLDYVDRLSQIERKNRVLYYMSNVRAHVCAVTFLRCRIPAQMKLIRKIGFLTDIYKLFSLWSIFPELCRRTIMVYIVSAVKIMVNGYFYEISFF